MLQQLQFNLGDTPAAPTGAAPRAPQAAPPSGPELKRQKNIQRILGEGNPRSPYGGSETVPVHRYGLKLSDVDEYDVKRFGDLPHDSYNFRRNAKTEFVNLTGPGQLETFQETVNPERVKQIAADPSMGSDPRFLGRELPKVVRTSDSRNLLINGTHRMAAARGYQGQLFTEARVLPEEKIEATPDWAQSAAAAKNAVAYDRYRTGNPRAWSAKK